MGQSVSSVVVADRDTSSLPNDLPERKAAPSASVHGAAGCRLCLASTADSAKKLAQVIEVGVDAGDDHQRE